MAIATATLIAVAAATSAAAGVATTIKSFTDKPSRPSSSAAPAPPSAEDPAVKARLEEERRQRGASGRASTLLADESLGVGSDIGSSTPDKNKNLLGAGYF